MSDKFKAIIFDLDGTAIALKEDALPSSRLIKAVESTKQIMEVCIATGRPITNCREILQELNLVSPCVISGGSQLINPKTEEILWEKKLNQNQVEAIVRTCYHVSCKLLFSDELLTDDVEMVPGKKPTEKDESVVFMMGLDAKDVPPIVKKLKEIPEIAVHPMPSWEKGKKDIHVTHKLATKQHALEVLNI